MKCMVKQTVAYRSFMNDTGLWIVNAKFVIRAMAIRSGNELFMQRHDFVG